MDEHWMYKYEPSNQCFSDLYGLRIIQQKYIYIYISLQTQSNFDRHWGRSFVDRKCCQYIFCNIFIGIVAQSSIIYFVCAASSCLDDPLVQCLKWTVAKCDHYRVRSCPKNSCHWSKKILLCDCPTKCLCNIIFLNFRSIIFFGNKWKVFSRGIL